MAGDNNDPVASVRDRVVAATETFNVEPFDEEVLNEIMGRLESLPESEHNDAIEQFLFNYYYGDKSESEVDEDGNISKHRLEELTSHVYLIETSLKLRDPNYTPGRDGPTLAAVCMEKYAHICQYLLENWETYEGAEREQRINELRQAKQHLLNSARVFTGSQIAHQFHPGFTLILRSMEHIETILPLHAVPDVSQPQFDE